VACEEVVKKFCQRAGAKKKYLFKFGPGLSTGETISGKSTTGSPSGLTLTDSLVGTDIIVLASGGTVGTTYRVTCKATTSDLQEIPLVMDLEIIAD
jgi:hypothetical protein